MRARLLIAFVGLLAGVAAAAPPGAPTPAGGRRGTYAAVIGDSFRAGLIGGVLPRGSAGSLAAKALDAHRGDGTAAVLEDFVRRVGDARAERGDDGGGFPFWILALFAIPAALYVWNR